MAKEKGIGSLVMQRKKHALRGFTLTWVLVNIKVVDSNMKADNWCIQCQ